METINSQVACNPIIGIPTPAGWSILGGKCSVSNCPNYAPAHSNLTVCPLHQPTPVWMNKLSVKYCPNCFDLFIPPKRKHHCRACGGVFCGDCADYQLLQSVPLRKPRDWFMARSRRICMNCAALISPAVVRKQVLRPGYYLRVHIPLDLVFCFDATASMSAHIRNVEENIDRIIEDIHSHHYVDLRVAAAAFRDHQYGDRKLNVIPFQNHAHKVERMILHINALSAQGNDAPESYSLGLGLVQSLTWRPCAVKLLILITDACPHGFRKDPHYDAYPNGDPSGLDPPSMVMSLVRDGVTLYTIGVENEITNNGGVQALKALAAYGRGLYVSLPDQTTNWRGNSELHHFISASACDLVLKTLCAQEITASGGPNGMNVNTVASRVLGRMASRTMPQFNLTGTQTYNEYHPGIGDYSAGQNIPMVTGVHREEMTPTSVSRYVQQVANNPPPYQ